MRTFLFITSIVFLPTISFAQDIDDQINKACLRHAVSLVSQLKSDVIGDMDQKQSDQALKIATESCQAYFKKEFSQNPETLANTSENKKESDNEGVKDWFTEKILSNDTSRKEGNERLKRLK